MGSITRWKSRRAVVNYMRCRTGKGNMRIWQKILDPNLEDDQCRECGLAEETGTHIALVCREMEGLGIAGRRFGSWEVQVDD